jgi:hypothetical protein
MKIGLARPQRNKVTMSQVLTESLFLPSRQGTDSVDSDPHVSEFVNNDASKQYWGQSSKNRDLLDGCGQGPAMHRAAHRDGKRLTVSARNFSDLARISEAHSERHRLKIQAEIVEPSRQAGKGFLRSTYTIDTRRVAFDANPSSIRPAVKEDNSSAPSTYLSVFGMGGTEFGPPSVSHVLLLKRRTADGAQAGRIHLAFS